MDNKKMVSVVVTTAHRGVFGGQINSEDRDSKTVVLYGARNCIYWSNDMHGFMGLASDGPSPSCRIGPKVPSITLHDVTYVVEMTTQAAQRWESAPWKM